MPIISRRKMLQLSAAAVPAISWSASSLSAMAESITTAGGTVLLQDDFADFPAGWLTRPYAMTNAAFQENQWVDERAHPFNGIWFNGVANIDAWSASLESETDEPYMMMMLSHPQHGAYASLVAGDPEWKDYTVEALVRPLAFDGVCGIGFRYQNNRSYYLFGFTSANTIELQLQDALSKTFRDTDWETVDKTSFPYTTDRYYALKVENEGSTIRCYVDGKKIFQTSAAKLAGGGIALAGNIPARFQKVFVHTPAPKKQAILSAIASREAEEKKLQSANPKARLLKKFSVDGFSCASNCRFGDLDGDGLPEMLFVQNIQTISRDAFDATSCMTAVKMDGTVLWQKGKPDPRNGWLTNDTPVQIHDVDGDGKAEVVCIRDFQIQILDGKTGKIKHKTWTPKAPKLPSDLPIQGQEPYDRVFGDSLFFVNVLGNKDRHEILIKDRYWNFWIYNNKLELLWKGTGQTGHAPYPIDTNGYDRIAVGYSMWDHTGKQLWTHDRDLHDHADSIAVANLTGDPNGPLRCYYTCSDEGFTVLDATDGSMVKKIMIGHAQNSSVGRYRPELPGRQFMTINFHSNVGIMYLFDADGNILQSAELVHNGSKLLPVNWLCNGQEFALLSTDPQYGGMLDGHFRRVVMFPDDGHPDTAYYVLDVDGDGRDEVVTWGEDSVWIYGADAPAPRGKFYSSVKNPLYNWSNYMSVVSSPLWRNGKE